MTLPKDVVALRDELAERFILYSCYEGDVEKGCAYNGFEKGFDQGYQTAQAEFKCACFKCGGIILADTEEWNKPLCYSCFDEVIKDEAK